MNLFHICTCLNKKNFLPSIFAFAALMFVFSVNLHAQNGTNTKKKGEIIDQEQKELDKAKKLHVKSRVKYVAFYNKQGQLPAKKEIAERLLFDKKGNRKLFARYKGLGQMDVKYSYNYNSRGNLVEAATYDPNGNMATKRISKFDKKGNEIERRMIDFDHKTNNKALFSYDKAGNLIGTKTYSDKGVLVSDLTLTYKDGLIAQAVTKDSKGEVTQEISSIYDSNGLLIREDRKSSGGSFSINYKYDSRGNLTEISNPEYRRVYDYDSNNNLIEDKMFLPNGARQFRVQFNYYPNGLQKEEIRYDTNDKPAFNGTYEYEFYK